MWFLPRIFSYSEGISCALIAGSMVIRTIVIFIIGLVVGIILTGGFARRKGSSYSGDIQTCTGVAFFAVVSNETNVSANENIIFDEVIVDLKVHHHSPGMYNRSTGEFVIPVNGRYVISTYLMGNTSNGDIDVVLYKDDSPLTMHMARLWEPHNNSISMVGVVSLNHGDKVSLRPKKPYSILQDMKYSSGRSFVSFMLLLPRINTTIINTATMSAVSTSGNVSTAWNTTWIWGN
ncbi:cerebellin-3-like [Mya arenaria]|uniref:cerebellin-3-like n=1 Tax=Mya arenaria TaxID=6604 RepID=UPI0022E56EF0|nr:cerebellin-3-like [Mya arenaria]